MVEQNLPAGLEEAAAMFRALSDPARLQTLILLSHEDRCVGALAKLEQEPVGTVSARLRVLRTAHLVKRRRAGRQVIYALADAHVLQLIENALAHATEGHAESP